MAAVGVVVSILGTTVFLSILLLLIVHDSCHARVYVVKSNINHKLLKAKTCKAHSNPHLHTLMDRVCQLCHEMFSYAMPNFRAECSERCYKNSKFRNCLNMFSVLPPDHPGGNEFTKLLMRIDTVEEISGGAGAEDDAGTPPSGNAIVQTISYI